MWKVFMWYYRIYLYIDSTFIIFIPYKTNKNYPKVIESETNDKYLNSNEWDVI